MRRRPDFLLIMKTTKCELGLEQQINDVYIQAVNASPRSGMACTSLVICSPRALLALWRAGRSTGGGFGADGWRAGAVLFWKVEEEGAK